MGDEEKVEIIEEVVSAQPKLIPPPDIDLLMDVPKPEVRGIVFFPDDRLKVEAEDVTAYDDELSQLVADMAMTMYSTGGIGLAAPQIGVSKRVFIADIFNGSKPQKGRPASQLLIVTNPVVMAMGTDVEEGTEGCLSFPGITAKVSRPRMVLLTAYDRRGKMFQLRCGGTLARVVQHEADHLRGILFTDRMSELSRREVSGRVRKFHKGVDRDKVRLVRKSG